MRKTSKTFSVLLLFCIMVMGLPNLSEVLVERASAEKESIIIKIYDKNVQFTPELGYPFLDQNGRTQVPLRVTMEAFGATVGYNDEKEIAFVQKDNITVFIPINENYIEVNGEIVQNDTSAVLVNDRTYCPIRKVLESFGATVSWDEENLTVVVSNTAQTNQTYTELSDEKNIVHIKKIYYNENKLIMQIDPVEWLFTENILKRQDVLNFISEKENYGEAIEGDEIYSILPNGYYVYNPDATFLDVVLKYSEDVDILVYPNNGIENKKVTAKMFEELINNKIEYDDVYELIVINGYILRIEQYYRP